MEGDAHVAQVSVAPDYRRLGIGRAMIELVEDWGRLAGCPATTLTTFRCVPCKAPYYARRGYMVLADHHAGPELLRTMTYEATLSGLGNPKPIRVWSQENAT